MANIAEQFGEFISTATFDDLPAHVVHEVKRVLLDSIGLAIAGCSTEKGGIVLDLARKLGGPAEATLIGTNGKVSSVNAAFANGELMSALDFHALTSVGRHDIPSTVPAQLAIAESTESSGKDLILASAIALEIAQRIKSAVTEKPSLEPDGVKMRWPDVFGQSCASLGAAAGVSKLLKLNKDMVANAIGLAGGICPPNIMRDQITHAPINMIKYASLGWNAQVGVTAALLSELGYTGYTEIFEGNYGFWRYTGISEGGWTTQGVLDGLGKKWLCAEIIYKQYPSGL